MLTSLDSPPTPAILLIALTLRWGLVSSLGHAVFPGWPSSFGSWYFWSNGFKFLDLAILWWSSRLDTNERPWIGQVTKFSKKSPVTFYLFQNTASFSWKQILLTPGLVFKNRVIGSWDRFTHWKLTPDNSVFKGRGQAGGAVPVSRVTWVPTYSCHSPLVGTWWAAPPHPLCGFLCFEVWTKWSSGANCTGPSLEPFGSSLGSACAFRLMSCFRRGWGPYRGGC